MITLMRPIATQGHLSDEICTRWSFSPKSGYGFRVIARKDGHRAKLYSRPGNDLTPRFPLIVKALARLRSRSCIIDGEAVARCPAPVLRSRCSQGDRGCLLTPCVRGKVAMQCTLSARSGT